MSLSVKLNDKRLAAAASLINKGSVLLDIGSDHAMLPISLIASGTIYSAIACDINPGPLEKGRENAEKHGITSIDFILSNGFENINQAFDTASILGMGGILISEILKEAGTSINGKTLILQPMTAADKLRKFLWENGFEILNELYTGENGKPYVIIHAVKTNNNTGYNFTELYLGKTRHENDPYYAGYCSKILNSAKKRLKGALLREEKADDLARLIKEASIYCK